MRKIFLISFVCVFITNAIHAQPRYDNNLFYRAILTTPGGELPFQMVLSLKGNLISRGEIHNGAEVINFDMQEININDSLYKNDSIRISLPVFNTEIVAKFSNNNNTLTGVWYDHSRPGNYYLPFRADYFQNSYPYRFYENATQTHYQISGRWDAVFRDESSIDSTVAIFTQSGNRLTGTFLTTTGDYRFLEGNVNADSIFLSTFDGSHAFLFKGKINDDGILTCDYWSGKHYHATIEMKRNENAHLPDATKLTYLNDGYSKIDFTFPDETGKQVSLQDEQFNNKPIIILITGSWCPNCMDEASYMSELEEKYKNTDLKIIALQFERQTDSVNFKKNMGRLRNHFGIDYYMLNAGSNKNASEALPMLNKVMGFPTTLVLNRRHDIAEIYTGFNGPATGELFLQYKKEFEELINKILL